MALIKCPECGKENVSDTAESCPNCGFGIKKYFEGIAERQNNNIQKESGGMSVGAMVLLVIGILFLILGLGTAATGDTFGYVFMAVGVVFAAIGFGVNKASK